MSLSSLCLIAVSVLSGPRGDVPGPIANPDFAALARRWERAAKDLGVAGAAVTVVSGSEVVHRQVLGERDVTRGLPVTCQSMFYIASATKPFIATAIRMLASEGKLDLDAPVKRYLPRFELADGAAAAAITVRDLLCHRPGLRSFPIVFLDAYTGEITEERYYHFMEQVRPAGEVVYSNLHFTLLGRVVQAVSGMEWRDFLEQRIFEPAGMPHTTGYATWMYAQEDVAYPSVERFDGTFALADVRKIDETMHAAGGLGTSIHDLGRWLLLHLGRGAVGETRLLPRRAHDELLELEGAFAEPDGWLRRMEGFGLGWQVGTYRGERYVTHGGGYVGTAAHVSFLPDLGLGVGVLANTGDGGQALCSVVSIDVYDFLLGDESGYDALEAFGGTGRTLPGAAYDEAAATEASALALVPADRAGVYENEWWGTLELFARAGARDGRMGEGRMGNLKFGLAALEGGRFRTVGNDALETEGAFELDSHGEVEALVIELSEDDRVRFARRHE